MAASWNQGGCGGENEKEIKQLLPTPTARQWKDTGAPSEFERKSPELLPTVLTLLPTPRTTDQNGAGRHGAGGADLRTTVSELKLLPTPVSADSRNSRQSTVDNPRDPTPTLSDVAYLWSGGSTVRQSDGGKPSLAVRLSHWFVEWMIGAPPDWSDPDCPLSATEFKYRWDDWPASTSPNSNGREAA
jgi:hypothetical protein